MATWSHRPVPRCLAGHFLAPPRHHDQRSCSTRRIVLVGEWDPPQLQELACDGRNVAGAVSADELLQPYCPARVVHPHPCDRHHNGVAVRVADLHQCAVAISRVCAGRIAALGCRSARRTAVSAGSPLRWPGGPSIARPRCIGPCARHSYCWSPGPECPARPLTRPLHQPPRHRSLQHCRPLRQQETRPHRLP